MSSSHLTSELVLPNLGLVGQSEIQEWISVLTFLDHFMIINTSIEMKVCSFITREQSEVTLGNRHQKIEIIQ